MRGAADGTVVTPRSRGRRSRAAALGLVSLIFVAALSTTPAHAETTPTPPPPPEKTEWYVTGKSAGAGVEQFTIRRDVPLQRGEVAVIERSGLYRLRTVMASEQLVGGFGWDKTTNLCRRVHCTAAINGDRFELKGHDAGRISSAAVIDGELIATQPRPPAGLAAHLLIGHDGSMDGTISFQLPLDPSVAVGTTTLPLDVNRQPTPERTSLLNRRYSTETRTPEGTVEYLFSAEGISLDGGVIAPLGRRESSGPIPEDAVVIAANGPERIAQTDALWSEIVDAGGAVYRTGVNGHREVIGGSPLLLDEGQLGFPAGDSDGVHPRTIVGWDATRVWIVTVDGRQPGWSTGMSLNESAELMRWLGATDALNLDGGGSTAFVGFGGTLRNRPSDGRQRHVATALVIMPPEGKVAPPPTTKSLDPACPAGRVPPGPFVDTLDNVHGRAIDCMAWWKVTSGTGVGTYSPGKAVRRDQMATFIAGYLHRSGVAFPADAPDAFPDDDESVHEGAIDILAAMGVVGGKADGRYHPGEPVTRAQMATFLAGAIALVTGADLTNTADYFADDSGNLHETNINKVTEAQIAGGVAGGDYDPGGFVRRDQMASFLARALSGAVENGKAAPPG